MAIAAKKLKISEIPGKTELYEVTSSRCIAVEEKQMDGSLDRVELEYCVEDGFIGYFAKEYRPSNVEKQGAKVIDLTAVMLSETQRSVRWHLYDIKDALAGENTVLKLYNQWNSGLKYLKENLLPYAQDYSEERDLGVITRAYDRERMERLRDTYQALCDELESGKENMSLAQRKSWAQKVTKARGVLKATQGILDRKFQPSEGKDTYDIHIRNLETGKDQVYYLRLTV